ncbi:MAG: hypothetical protein ABSA18_11910 [Dehalococcoidia bacterium]|jgi:mRNA-degrading endonuclease RelE of RelBE toxin-antitoxin system
MSRKRFKEIIWLPEFERDLKRLAKKFRTIEDDLNVFIETELYLFHKLKLDINGIFRITGLSIEDPEIYKAKKFACRSLKGKGVHSGIRVVYGYFSDKDRILLIEIYYKGDKENEDRERIQKLR